MKRHLIAFLIALMLMLISPAVAESGGNGILEEVSSVPLSTFCSVMWNNTLYNCEGSAIRVYDIASMNLSTMTASNFTDSLYYESRVTSINISAGTLYATSYDKLEVAALNDRLHPVILGNGTNASSTSSSPIIFSGVAVTGGYAYVGGNKYLTTFDVSDPTAPTISKSVALPYLTSGTDGTRTVIIDGDFVYTNNRYQDTIQIWNISTPQTPVLETSYDYDGAGGYGSSSMAYANNTLYIADYHVRLISVNVTTRTAPEILESTSIIPGSATGINAVGTAIVGNKLFVSSRYSGDYATLLDGGFRIYDITNRTLLIMGENESATGYTEMISSDGTRVAVARDTGGTNLYNATNPYLPVYSGHLMVPTTPFALIKTTFGTVPAIGSTPRNGGDVFFNVTDPRNMTRYPNYGWHVPYKSDGVSASIHGTRSYNINIVDDWMLTSYGGVGNGALLTNLSDINSVEYSAPYYGFQNTSNMYWFVMNETRIYANERTNDDCQDFRIYNVSDKSTHPILITDTGDTAACFFTTSSDFEDGAFHFYHDGYLLSTNGTSGYNGIIFVNITDESAPSIYRTFAPGLKFNYIRYNSTTDKLYASISISSTTSQLSILDVSDMDTITFDVNYTTPSSVLSFDVNGTDIFAATVGTQGFKKYDFSDYNNVQLIDSAVPYPGSPGTYRHVLYDDGYVYFGDYDKLVVYYDNLTKQAESSEAPPPLGAGEYEIYINVSYDGYVEEGTPDASFATLRAAAGDNSNSVGTTGGTALAATSTADVFTYLRRFVSIADLSALETNGSTSITYAKFCGYVYSGTVDLGAPPKYAIFGYAPASYTAIANGDYDNIDDTVLSEWASSPDLTTGNYECWEFNEAGRTWLNESQDRGIMVRDWWDVGNSFNGTFNASDVSGIVFRTNDLTYNTPYLYLIYSTESGTAPTAAFSGTPTSGTEPLTVTFTDMSTGDPTGWVWNFGDGNSTNSSAQNPVHTFLSSGSYDVALDAYNDVDNSTETKYEYITVDAPPTPPVAAFSANATSGASPLSVLFTDASTNTPTSWYWTFGGANHSTSQNPVYTFTGAGVYTVSLDATNADGSDTETKTNYITVSVAPDTTPPASITGLTNTTVSCSAAFFNWTNPTASDYGNLMVWRNNTALTNLSSTTTGVSWTGLPEAKDITFSSKTCDTTGNCNATFTNKTHTTGYCGVTPVAAFSCTPTSFIVGGTATCTDTSTNIPTSWLWDFGDGNTSTSRNPTHQYNVIGTFSVSLRATNAYGSDWENKSGYITSATPPVACVQHTLPSHHYDLELLMHGNLELPDLSTSNFNDSSRNFFPGYAMLNSTSIPDGRVNINTTQKKYGNSSIFYSGPMSNVTIADNAAFTFGTGNHSVCGWIYWPYTVQEVRLFYHRTDANNYDMYSVSSANDVQIQHYRSGSSVGSNAVSAGTIYPGLWNQVCFIKNGTVTTAYLNGTSFATVATQTGSYTDLTGPVRIGDSNGFFPSHYIDELTVTNGGLAPSIQDLQGEWPLYRNGTLGGYADDDCTASLLHFDNVNNGINITDQYANRTWIPTGAVTATNYSKFTSSGYFNSTARVQMNVGTTDFDMGTGDWSIDGWVYPTARGSSYNGIFTTMDTTGDGYVFSFWSDGYFGLTSNASGVSAQHIISPIGTVPLNTWSHLAAVRNGTVIRLYYNGNYVKSQTISAAYSFNSYGHIPAIGTTFTNSPSTWTFKGYIDELRVTKGLARWTGNFTPPYDPYELIEDNGFTPSPDAAGHAPATIQFNDTTPSSAWTANVWNWSFGDTLMSSLQSPSHTYTSTGNFNAVQVVSNNNMTTSYSHYVPVGPPHVDFVAAPLSGTAALTVVFTDLTTNETPITSYLIDFGDGESSTETPPWTHVYATYGAFTVNLTETNSIGTGFENKRDYILVSTSQNPPQVQSYPVYVRFIFSEGFGTPLSGVNVTITPMSTSVSSYSWLEQLIGIPLSQVPITNQTMYQVSGTDGVGAFYVIPTTQYTITFGKTGYTFNPASLTTTFTNPQAVYVWGSSTGATEPSFFEDGLDENNAITFTVTTVKVNDTASFLNMTYSDITATTSTGSVTVVVRNSTPYGANNTVVTWPITSSSVTNSTLITHGVAEVNGESYMSTTTTRFGIVNKSVPFSMKGQPVSFMGFGPEIALLFALFIMMMTVMIGTAQTARQVTFGGLAFEMWVFYAIGWFDSLIARGVPEAMLLLGMTIVTVVAIFAIFEVRKKKEKY